jgi:ubiquinone/menaquinone biosynthesis C-methylase UbiE
MSDKTKEKKRYDRRASSKLTGSNLNTSYISADMIEPYQAYNSFLSEIPPKSKILEIGAGMGENTSYLLDLGHEIVVTDISPKSVEFMNKRFKDYYLFNTQVADMEKLPFDNDSFDCVCSAGSLSYGDNDIVMSEIYRVLKTGGLYIAVDSLNNSFIYRFNRFIHYLMGKRSKSTLKRMPDLDLIENYNKRFGSIEVKYFGSLTWLFPIMKIFMTEQQIKIFSQNFDKKFKVKKSAFKFTMKLRKQ